MKITGGKYKSITLFSVNNRRVRHTTSKTKLAIFSILDKDVENANVLELFCGSGAFSAEAISRGAFRATLVDIISEAIFTVKKNMAKINFSNFEVIRMDYRRALRYLNKKGQKFDIVFADPPYDAGYGQEILVNIEKNSQLLKDTTTIILELSINEFLFVPETFIVETDRNFGDTRIVFLKRSKRVN
ncbi:MAG: rRNA (guanine966-N2)-methyltransferase [Thermotogaceae bacterium]|nr:rRNA (guanine966-N2)-methyltransferase [Thermotogaceae bacterium]MDN5337502.1 rRNA (guanine966-N2)-methyltransferase [Thermotogaceae bacterium]